MRLTLRVPVANRSASKIFCKAVCLVGSLALGLGCVPALSAQQGSSATAHLSIDASKIVTPVSPTLYGLMTEEINHSYDGGLYAELVQNRTMRSNWEGPNHWALVRRGNSQASMSIDRASGPSKALPYSMKLTVTAADSGSEAGVSNTGFWGMAAKPRTTYHGSFYAKVDDAAVGPIVARLLSDRTGAILGEATVAVHAGPWSKYEYSFTTANLAADAAASAENHLQLTLAKPGTVWLQLVSLMPPTFNGRPNGNRPDLMERMSAMHPKFLRLPGGNYLEGDTLKDWYNWKETIGPLVDRPGHQAPWSYWSTDGLGLLEFLEWCEDLKVEPVLAVYAGYALHGDRVLPGKDLEPFIDAALDEVEYVTGGPETKWGAERIRDGHPAPFPLNYIEIGNEDFFDKSGSYDARFGQFAKAFRKRYPQYKLIATTPVKEQAVEEQADLIDDHYYKPPAEMMDFVHHYDNAPRTGPKIFVGEWATRSGSPMPNFGDALGDAAWMTAMERNSDLILIASYAPLLVNVNPGAMQWTTDLIGFDALQTYASPSYYAQCLFAAHLGQGTAESSLTGGADRFFYSATVNATRQLLHLKLVNASDRAQPLSIDLRGVSGKKTAKVTTLHAASYEATNSSASPDFIRPVESTVLVSGASWKHTIPAFTIEVMDIPLQ